jgi:hypothetical protein
MRNLGERDALLQSLTENGPSDDHFVQFYDDDARLARAVGDFLAAGLRRRGSAIVIALPERAEAIRHHLTTLGHDPDALVDAGRLVCLDGQAILRSIMVEDMPSEQRFRQEIGTALERLVDTCRPARVRAYGELVDLLWAAGNVQAAARLEEMWNVLVSELNFALFCAYSARHFTTAQDRDDFDVVCRLHGRILPVDRDLLRAL